jgi:hypothetical protein
MLKGDDVTELVVIAGQASAMVVSKIVHGAKVRECESGPKMD